MYKSFTVKNFRGFGSITLAPLERISLIAGKNNVGKTALLEAIFLHLGPNNPGLTNVIDGIRGIDRIQLEPDEVWGWLFREKDTDRTIELKSTDEEKVTHVLRIRLCRPTNNQVLLGEDGQEDVFSEVASPASTEEPKELIMEYEDPGGRVWTSKSFLSGDTIKYERAALPSKLPRGLFIGSRAKFTAEDPERFSQLIAKGRRKEVLNPMKSLEPRLRSLEVLVRAGKPVIHGDIGIGELLPVLLMGEGVGRLLSIVVAIANAAGGTLLIDEIEDGFHHSIMVDVWKAVAHAARLNNTQVFATTHSWECIRAAHEAFSASESYDFCLHRLDRIDSKIQAVVYDQETLESALNAELEVR